MNQERSVLKQGNVTLKPSDGQICFQWYFTAYPESGCFLLVETAPDNFALRKLHGHAAVLYYSLPSAQAALAQPAKELPMSARP